MPFWSQPGIYNVLDYGMVSGSGGSGASNAGFLQDAINAAELNGGGIILIPSDDNSNDGNIYSLAPQVGKTYAASISGNYPLLIMGTGEATKLVMTESGDVFDTSSFSGSSLTFQDLYVLYNQKDGNLTGTAFNLTNCRDALLFRVFIDDCQYPVALNGVTQGSIVQCTISYSGLFPGHLSAVCVAIGANSSGTASSQVELDACVFRVSNAPADANYIGLLITAVSGLYARSVQISDFTTGIKITPSGSSSCLDMYLDMVEAPSTGYATLIQPQSNASSIMRLTFSRCAFHYNGSPASSIGALVDIAGYSNSQIDTVRFANCNAYSYSQYGLQVTGGQYISVTGGTYASNATAGVAITGGAANVTIDNATFTGESYDDPAATQNYGIVVENGATNVLINACNATRNAQAGIQITSGATDVVVDGCNLAGNSVNGITVTDMCVNVYINSCDVTGYSSGNGINASSPGILQVVNCAGYNDQAQMLTTSPPASGNDFNGLTYGYYGPATFYVFPPTGATLAIAVDGTNTHLPYGTFTIGPTAPSGGESAVLTYAVAPSFLMIGE